MALEQAQADILTAFAEDEGYSEAKDLIKDFNRMREALKSVYRDIKRIDSETGVLGIYD